MTFVARINHSDVLRLISEGHNKKTIAAMLACDPKTIYRIVRRHNINIPRGKKQTQKNHKASIAFWKQHDNDLRRIIASGATTAEAAHKIGVTKNAVIGRADRLGLLWQRSPQNRKKPETINNIPTLPLTETLPPKRHCLWTIVRPGHANLGWCGQPAKRGSNYCEEHHEHILQKTDRGQAVMSKTDTTLAAIWGDD